MTIREFATPVAVKGLRRLLDTVSEQRLAATVATLCSRKFAGRRVGSPGGAAARTELQTTGGKPFVVNVDGAGHLHQAAAVEAGGPAHGLLAALDQAGRHIGLPLAAGPVASDNRRNAAAGLAAVGIGAGMAGYHSPADTPDRVQSSTMAALARLVVAATLFTVNTLETQS